MKKIFFFSIPAHGHTNPMVSVAEELVKRGNVVRFYSFDQFKEKIEKTGAEFISCDSFSQRLKKEEEQRLKEVSTTEMTMQDIQGTINIDAFLDKEYQTHQPDVVYVDSVCFWGKLSAWKHGVPVVVSTSTFAFNQLSVQYMSYSSRELRDMIFGLPKISKELKKLKPYGYHVKSALSLVQSDNNTDSVVYTSREFQPYGESFSKHYAFVGPSVSSSVIPNKKKERPLIYIALGTVIHDRPDFYKRCMEALCDLDAEVILACGTSTDIASLGTIPKNVQVFPYVDQIEVLSKADVFLSHCGMNSVSESLYMATPLILYPQTSEQKAVARRVVEKNAGKLLQDDSVQGIRSAVLELLNNPIYQESAKACCDDLRSCSGSAGAAEFIENAPHVSDGIDMIQACNKASIGFQVVYYLFVIALIILLRVLFSWNYAWVIGVIAGLGWYPIGKMIQNRRYQALTKK